MNQQEWFDHCIKNGTSGDQIFDILKDWEVDRLTFLDQIKELKHIINLVQEELDGEDT